MCTFVVKKQLEWEPTLCMHITYCIHVMPIDKRFRDFIWKHSGFLQPPSGKQTVRNVNIGPVKAASDLSADELTVKYSSETNCKKCHLTLFYPIVDIQYAIQLIAKIQTLE